MCTFGYSREITIDDHLEHLIMTAAYVNREGFILRDLEVSSSLFDLLLSRDKLLALNSGHFLNTPYGNIKITRANG
jgi:hypothetical protein